MLELRFISNIPQFYGISPALSYSIDVLINDRLLIFNSVFKSDSPSGKHPYTLDISVLVPH